MTDKNNQSGIRQLKDLEASEIELHNAFVEDSRKSQYAYPIFEQWVAKNFKKTTLAVEGVAGTGKSMFAKLVCEAIDRVVTEQFFSDHPEVLQRVGPNFSFGGGFATMIKRPLPNGPAEWLLRDHDSPNNAQIQRALADDAFRVAKIIKDDDEPIHVLDRHWLTTCANQNPGNLHGALTINRQENGEPDVWVIMSAEWPTVARRMRERGESVDRQIDRTCNNYDIFTIGGRLAAFEFMAGLLRSPVFLCKFDSKTDGYDVQCYNVFNSREIVAGDIKELAEVVAQTVVELAMEVG